MLYSRVGFGAFFKLDLRLNLVELFVHEYVLYCYRNIIILHNAHVNNCYRINYKNGVLNSVWPFEIVESGIQSHYPIVMI